MPSYPEAGGDWFGYPQHKTPSWLTPLGQQLFQAVEAELVEQGKKATLLNSSLSGEGYVVFRQDKDHHVLLDCEINLARLVEGLQKVIEEYEPEPTCLRLGSD
jgi:hypothetical protein